MEPDDQASDISAGTSSDHVKAQQEEAGPGSGPPASGSGPHDTRLVTSDNDVWAGTRMMVALAGSVVLLLGMRAAADVVAPLVLALVVAVGVAPAIGWLERKGLRTTMAFAITVIVTVVVELAIIILLSISLAGFALSLPDYEDEIEPLWNSVVTTLDSAGIDVESLVSFENIDSERLVAIGLQLLGSITGLFSTLFLVTFTAAFMLLETTTISRKMEVSGMAGATTGRVEKLAGQLRAFVKVSALLGAVVAIIVTILLLLILDVPNAILWGLLSFFFILALIPPALLLTGGWSKIMGTSTDTSPLAVFVSLVIFGWALGPLGGLLAVPMLLIVKGLLFDAYPEWRFLSAVLAKTPAELEESQGETKQAVSTDPEEKQ